MRYTPNHHSDVKRFKHTAKKTKMVNLGAIVMRGGFRF